MKNSYLILLFCFRTSILSAHGANFTESKSVVDVILPVLSLSGYAIPIEGLIVCLFVFMIVYWVTEYNARLLSHEKYKITLNLLHSTSTPLVLLRHELQNFSTANFSEPVSRQLKQILEVTDCLIGYNQNIVALDRVGRRSMPEASATKFELYTYVASIVNQCRPYAGFCHVQLKMNECSEYISCKINENFLTAALQHLLNRIIETTEAGNCVHIRASHTEVAWQLHMSNSEEPDSEPERMYTLIPAMFPIHGYHDLRVVKKIIRLHGGKVIGGRRGKTATFQVTIPTDCHCSDEVSSGINLQMIGRRYFPHVEPLSGENERQVAGNNPCILLVMADNLFSSYMEKALSDSFRVLILEDPDRIINVSMEEKPAAIITDENVNGMSGDELCLRIRTEQAMADIPVVILVRGGDNESYLSHAGSGADRLELRTVNICKLKVDLCMLINNHTAFLTRMKRFLSGIPPYVESAMKQKRAKEEAFLNKVRGYMEENLAIEKYGVKRLAADMGMCGTSFFNRIREITGKSPEKYMLAFKMERAAELLISDLYSVTEVAGMLGFCDAKYFGKKFKEYYHESPTRYVENYKLVY